MAYSFDKDSEDIIFNGFEQGIQPSPHKGIANLQNVNISTETGEVTNSFARVQDTMTNTSATGTLSYVDTSHVALSIANTNNLFKGNWITVTNSSNTAELPNGTYYVPPSSGANFQLSHYYDNGISQLSVTIGALLAGGGGGGGDGLSATGPNPRAGGGGGGGQVLSTTTTITQQTYNIVIGGGGTHNTNGTSTTFSSLTAIGGGAGGNGDIEIAAISGASGGGGFSSVTAAAGAGASGTAGNSGGNGATPAGNVVAGGGGGGAGTIGSVGISTGSGTGGTGGNGSNPSIGGETYSILGAGGGGGVNASGAAGAVQGGSGAGSGGINTTGGNASNNSAAGGGGAGAGALGNTVYNGGTGGSGIVVIAAPLNSFVSVVTTGTHTSDSSYDYWTFTSNGTWFPTLNTVSNNPFLTGFTTGLTANFTMVATMGKPIATPTQPETYYLNGVNYNRYYILDSNNLVWVYDTQNETTYASTDNVSWFLPDFQTNWCTHASGIAVISGWVFVTASDGVFAKPVVQLGNTASTSTTWTQLPDLEGWSGIGTSTTITHFCLTSKTGNLYIMDASYVVGIFPDSALADPGNSTTNNVQTLCSWVETSSTQGTYSVISGTSPVTSDDRRLPVVFFTEPDGSLPTALTASTIFYIEANAASQTFSVYSASTGGSALDLLDGASGVQYFNSFYPIAQVADVPTYVLTNPQVALPVFEIGQCMAELNTTVLIGCVSNIVYAWNQQATQSTAQIPLPESNTVLIIVVHNLAYLFPGNKGNVYLTEGTTSSLATTVPDYCAGIPGTPSSYIEPYFVWQSAMYLRGHVYFSLLDQTSTKAGNCGGIWSLVPTQDLFIGQDVGTSLRLENQNSYGTYNGAASILIPKVNQKSIAPQYFSGWESSITSPTYGIDATGTGTASTSVGVIETDLISTGTILDKKTFEKTMYKLASALPSGANVALNFRTDVAAAWISCTNLDTDSTEMSGYYPVNFQTTEVVQLQAILTPATSSPGTFIRLSDLRLH